MGAINRAPFNALVDDDGSGLTGTVWNKTQIKNVILDPADVAYNGLIQAAEGASTNAAYHNLFGANVTGMTVRDTLFLHYQLQAAATAAIAGVQVFKNSVVVADLVAPLAANEIAMGTARFRPAAMQSTIAGTLLQSVIYPTNARRDSATWIATAESFTVPWALVINCTGVPAGSTLYWYFGLYKLAGQ